MRVCAPTDSRELVAQLREAIRDGKPTYIRIGKKGEPLLINNRETLGIGKANLIAHGKNTLVLGIGPILNEALKAHEQLKHEGIPIGVASMGSVKPIDQEFLKECITKGYTNWICLEEHHKTGGLGSAILEWISENKEQEINVIRIGIGDHFIHSLGNQAHVREAEGLTARFIREATKRR